MFGSRLPGNPGNSVSAVVTGAGSGIGRAFALEIARRRGAVLCSDIDEAAAQLTADEIVAAGGRAWAVVCDVSKIAEVQKLARQAGEILPQPVNLVVNNAGVGAGGKPVGETPLTDWKWTLGINLWGVIHGCHVFAPLLRHQGHGGIVNVASTASYSAAPLMGPYNVSKAGVLALSETLAAELAGTGVKITALCPTLVKTNINANGRIVGDASKLFDRLMDRFGMAPDRVVRMTLDAHQRGDLYVMPQFDARLIWRAKRLMPRTYAMGAGLFNRLH
ncbi:SDR family NAD(P)-dependent oxidoreductase [Marinobacter fonticola]|uniref:SDR family NAD(P)-dependent oxidoreductase n=1 Tax=Marinobacter fonticola TaxID=2603215 RepID=UPI0011E68A18|nr:SDR family NAD(P)-dependent oxidoreductase [Marinobacter fonticola]